MIYTLHELNGMNASSVTTLTNTIDNCIVRLFACPKCDARPGRCCRTRTDNIAPWVHVAREDAATTAHV
jgi:hypothetical protein